MKISKTEVYGFESALRGMRNPMNSWHLQDTIEENGQVVIGEKDLKLAQTLTKAGTEHCKFMRQIQVWVDIEAPRYWWSEFDTYKIGTSANSTSTMHKLFNKKSEITIDLFEVDTPIEKDHIVNSVIPTLNDLRDRYLYEEGLTQKDKDKILAIAKRILPEAYLNLRTVNLNYAVIRHIVSQRKHHRLKMEWQEVFCKWATTLPYSRELIFVGMEDDFERLK